MITISRTRIAVAAGLLSVSALVGGAATLAAGSPAGIGHGAPVGTVSHRAPSGTIYEGAPLPDIGHGSMPGTA